MKTNNKKYTLILASKSPRREELLSLVKIPFEISAAKINEKSHFTDPVKIAQDIAKQKGVAVYKEMEKRKNFKKSFFPLIVAADTIVSLKDKVFGKPKNITEAEDMLLELSGKKHQVTTGVYLALVDIDNKNFRENSFYTTTSVQFTSITQDLLGDYLARNDSLDKAGAYGIQSGALTFVSQIQGSYSNVVGFPLSDFIFELKSFIGHDNDHTGLWKNLF